MKAKCFNCGKEFEWYQEEDWQICEYCNGKETDEVGENCIFCKGTGFVDVTEDTVPTCEECFFLEEESNVP